MHPLVERGLWHKCLHVPQHLQDAILTYIIMYLHVKVESGQAWKQRILTYNMVWMLAAHRIMSRNIEPADFILDTTCQGSIAIVHSHNPNVLASNLVFAMD